MKYTVMTTSNAHTTTNAKTANTTAEMTKDGIESNPHRLQKQHMPRKERIQKIIPSTNDEMVKIPRMRRRQCNREKKPSKRRMDNDRLCQIHRQCRWFG